MEVFLLAALSKSGLPVPFGSPFLSEQVASCYFQVDQFGYCYLMGNPSYPSL
jgi:hypothetical protein